MNREDVISYFDKLEDDVRKGFIVAYHGTTTEIFKKIKKEGFKLPDFGSIIRQAYIAGGIPWEKRKLIPRTVRQWIESDARGRILTPDTYMFISFAPTYSVAKRWAGKGGEVLHETEMRVRMVRDALEGGARTTTKIFDWIDNQPRGAIRYRNLGDPIVVEAIIPLSSFYQKMLLHEIRGIKEDIVEGEDPIELLKAFDSSYKDIRVQEVEKILINRMR